MNNEMFDKRKGRLIVVDGIKWKWKAGRDSVVANSERGERRCDRISNVIGRDHERGQWKRTSDGMVTPADIANWLSKKK